MIHFPMTNGQFCGKSEVEDLDSDVQDYNTEEDYNDVFDSTTNGTDVDATAGSKSGTLKFVRTLSNISKDEGGVAHMRCEAVGDPPPTKIRWYKNEAPLEEKRPKITIRKIHAQAHEHAAKNVAGSRLKITNLDVSDVGFYSCRVTNGKDQIQSEGTLRVDSTQKWQGKTRSAHDSHEESTLGYPLPCCCSIYDQVRTYKVKYSMCVAPVSPIVHSDNPTSNTDEFSSGLPAGSSFIEGMDNTNRLDISGISMSTPHISHLAPTNSLNVLSPSPQPTSSQSSTVDFSTLSGLKNVNMQVPSGMVNFAGFPGMNSIPGKKDNHEGTCETYVGKTCAQFVGNQTVYILYPMTQKLLEDKLIQAFGVINFSNDLSSNCESYAKPSLCYSTFPICRNPPNNPKPKNSEFSEFSSKLFNRLQSNQDEHLEDGEGEDSVDDYTRTHGLRRKRNPTLGPGFEFNPSKERKGGNQKIINQSYGDTRSSNKNEMNRKLRRICREECELLENELCRTEYAIAKRHPLIGQVPLLECSDLPLKGSPEAQDCLSVSISTENDVQENEYCYWGNGESYRGAVNTSISGRPCLKWSHLLMIHKYPVWRHSYCRNPSGQDLQPWCFVDANNRMQKEFCHIPKCVENLWIYAVVGFVLMGGFVTIIICYCCCYRSRKSRRQMNHLPSNKMLTGIQCDKNIYDGRRSTTQPMEMSSLLAGPGNTTPGTGTLSSGSSRTSNNRVPQFTTNNVVLLQELGEGAFGK
ncbi:hypothetical protein M0804_000146 [Polistes exclamans]|nr:hypothetical protein M0804_000146 [Polistes exclamans]